MSLLIASIANSSKDDPVSEHVAVPGTEETNGKEDVGEGSPACRAASDRSEDIDSYVK